MGNFTYIKGEKKSQIDYVLTDENGRNNVDQFQIIENNWHLSDHRPIQLSLLITRDVNIHNLLIRAIDLNKDAESNCLIRRFNSNYDYSVIKEHMILNRDTIYDSLTQCQSDPNVIIQILNEQIISAHSQLGAKKKVPLQITGNQTLYNACNEAYKNYNDLLIHRNVDETTIDEAANKYKNLRDKLTVETLKDEHTKWEKATEDAKNLWNKIDWKGKLNSNDVRNQPSLTELALHFEELYRSDDNDNIMQLKSSVTIPVLDDPITENEIRNSVQKMKKGGYDYPLPIMQILYSLFSPVLMILLNMMFYVQYPTQCLISLLFAIPKKGGIAFFFKS